MGIRPINNILDRHIFRKEYNRLARMNVPAEYVRDCILYGWYDDQNELLGGYAFAEAHQMAWPALVGQNLSFFREHDIESCLEFNMAWAKDPLHDQVYEMIKFWVLSGKKIQQLKHIKYVTFAVDASYSNLVKMYERIATEVVFRGTVSKYPDREVIVFAAPRQRFDRLFWIYLPEFAKRIQKNIAKRFRSIETRAILQTKEV